MELPKASVRSLKRALKEAKGEVVEDVVFSCHKHKDSPVLFLCASTGVFVCLKCIQKTDGAFDRKALFMVNRMDLSRYPK